VLAQSHSKEGNGSVIMKNSLPNGWMELKFIDQRLEERKGTCKYEGPKTPFEFIHAHQKANQSPPRSRELRTATLIHWNGKGKVRK
jgi:hypothetical protein